KTFSIRVTGGTGVAGKRHNSTLTIPVTPAMMDEVIFISPVTTIAHKVAVRTGTSYPKALKRTLRSLGIPAWSTPADFSGIKHVFDPHEFHAYATTKGGHRQAIEALVKDVIKGERTHRFASRPTPRADDAEEVVEDSLAEKLATVALEAVVWKGAQAVLGKYLPVDPAMAELSSQLNAIQQELNTISEQLNIITADINEILVELSQLSYNTAYETISEPASDIPPLWTKYQQFAAEYACPYWEDPDTCTVPTSGPDSYEANATDLATQLCGLADFSNAGQPMSLWSNLFTTTAGNTGVIPALYQMYSTETAFWTADDLDDIYQTIDFYGTLQAQGTIMLNDAWSYIPQGKKNGPCNRPSTAASNDINTYVEQNNNIRVSLPSGYTTPGIVIPSTNPTTADSSTETLLQSFPVQSPKGAVGGKYAPYSFATCSDGTTMSTSQYSDIFEPYVPLLTPDQFTSTWESVIPTGYEIAHSSDLSTYRPALTGIEDGVTGLEQIVTTPTGNIAQAVVTAESAPIASAQWDPTSAYTPEAVPAGIMWCNSATLGAALDDDTQWVTNFTMTTSNFGNEHVYADGLTLKNGFSVPLGVLATTKVKAHYVAPYDGAPAPTTPPCVPGQEDCVGDSISEATPMPGTWACNGQYGYCDGLEQANGEFIDDYNDHDVYSFVAPQGNTQYLMNGPVGSLAKLDPCTFCGFTIYNPAQQAIMTCDVAADCFTGSAGEEAVFFMVDEPGTYYIDVYRSPNATLPNPTNVTYQVQLASNLEPGCEVNCSTG
ncbi:MAG: hypothetical protein RL134_653, partial [Actinomycetota bacterium]